MESANTLKSVETLYKYFSGISSRLDIKKENERL